MVFKKIIFQNRYVALKTLSRPPPIHGKYHLKFPFWLFAHLPKEYNNNPIRNIFYLNLKSNSPNKYINQNAKWIEQEALDIMEGLWNIVTFFNFSYKYI